MAELTVLERKALKARAHGLEPVVLLGNHGLSEAVLAEIGRALAAHELIKVRAPGLDRQAREAALAEISARLDARPVQHIGKVLVLYRENPPGEKAAAAPEARTAPGAKRGAGSRPQRGRGSGRR